MCECVYVFVRETFSLRKNCHKKPQLPKDIHQGFHKVFILIVQTDH